MPMPPPPPDPLDPWPGSRPPAFDFGEDDPFDDNDDKDHRIKPDDSGGNGRLGVGSPLSSSIIFPKDFPSKNPHSRLESDNRAIGKPRLKSNLPRQNNKLL